MGLEIERTEFTEIDYATFGARLNDDLEAFRLLLERDGFGAGPASLGAELEVYIVDDAGRANPINRELQAARPDLHLSLELNRFNLEFDFEPQPAAGAPLSHYTAEMQRKVHSLDDTARERGAAIAAVGILPTLRDADFGPDAMSPTKRYEALTDGLRRLGDGRFRLHIDGLEPLRHDTDQITLEGATTSFQLHLRVPPDEFVKTYNAIQLASPLALALGANSPVLLGRRLWHETRIALFKQSIDSRSFEAGFWRPPARVSFGTGWLRGSAAELFAEGVRLHPPILPIVQDEDPLAVVREGGVPSLHELRLHNGTIWSWNRPVYDPHGDGHLRIEMRALPAGPTAVDMLANAALFLGLAVSLRDDIDQLLPALPFQLAEYNFYRAAQLGLTAPIIWPDARQVGLRERRLLDVAGDLLGRARDGLGRLGMDDAEISRFLGVIRDRVAAGQNGAVWQFRRLEHFGISRDRDAALARMLEEYLGHQRRGLPVHEWPLGP